MIMAIALLVIVMGSLLFPFLNPWWTTSLASNWTPMADMLPIPRVTPGMFFVCLDLIFPYPLWTYPRS